MSITVIEAADRAQPDLHKKRRPENRIGQPTLFQAPLDCSLRVSKGKVSIDILRKREINKRGNSGSFCCVDKIGLPGAVDVLDGVTPLARNHHGCRRDYRLDSPTSSV